VKFAAPNASEIEVAELGHEHITEPEQLLSETLAVQTEQDQRLVQLTDELTLKGEYRSNTHSNITGEAEGRRAWETAGET
jgi:hypothetical protein